MKFHSITQSFQDEGFFSPVRIFSKNQCKFILQHIKKNNLNINHNKGSAINSTLFYEISKNSKIVDIVSSMIGENILLWGACVVYRKPGTSHPWHTDIETSMSKSGKTVSVWIGLKNTKESSLNLISHSHKLNKCFQQAAFENNVKRGEANNKEVLTWAQQISKSSKLVTTNLMDGEAIFFDGKLWHSSFNYYKSRTRTAILLQYTTPDNEILGLNPKNLEWPFKNKGMPKPECLLMNGVNNGPNKLVDPPKINIKVKNKLSPKNKRRKLKNLIQSIELPLKEDKELGWKPFHILKGYSKSLDHITNHISVLSPGHSPHPPHTHIEEEILIMISGEADIVLGKKEERIRLKPGQFSYYPSFYPHTIDNTGSEAATYMMFKWSNRKKLKTDKMLSRSIFNYNKDNDTNSGKGKISKKVFESPTLFLNKLHCHTTLLKPGGGYQPHRDNYDVAIVLLEGEVKTLVKEVKSLSSIYYPKGEPHGIKNIGNSDAFYLVFEFHGKSSLIPSINNFNKKNLIRHLKNTIRKFTFSN